MLQCGRDHLVVGFGFSDIGTRFEQPPPGHGGELHALCAISARAAAAGGGGMF